MRTLLVIVSLFVASCACAQSRATYDATAFHKRDQALPLVRSTTPSALSGALLLFAESTPAPLLSLEGATGLVIPTLPVWGTARWALTAARPQGTTLMSTNEVAQGGGTAGACAFDSGTLIGRTIRTTFATTAVANQSTYQKAAATGGLRVYRGDAAGKGGFITQMLFAANNVPNGIRFGAGLHSSATLTWGSADPSTAPDAVYFGCDAGQDTLRVCSNDAAGAATCADLGASFPCTTTGALYQATLWAAPNAASVNYKLERLDVAASTTGTLAADLPTNTTALYWDVGVGSAALAVAVSFDFISVATIAGF